MQAQDPLEEIDLGEGASKRPTYISTKVGVAPQNFPSAFVINLVGFLALHSSPSFFLSLHSIRVCLGFVCVFCYFSVFCYYCYYYYSFFNIIVHCAFYYLFCIIIICLFYYLNVFYLVVVVCLYLFFCFVICVCFMIFIIFCLIVICFY